MKTARFETIVQRCGKPEAHLVLTAPAKDRTLQSAVKEKRVMTVVQESVGTKADRGEVGFHPGPGRQFLLFPKSLRAFAEKAVVGIKYELLESPAKSEGRKSPPTKKKKPARSKRRDEPKRARAANVVEFKRPVEDNEENEEVVELKKQVRRAMAALEDGKQVAAFNLLKRIAGD